ncbi:hypothetical protein ACQP2U_42395 (plasmid) [Nocardia sp. CA-084685]|uniref:hypothetical protein n=1 Tax=Nocardia sp. CA-084685 TaxID=3239970 RepID=UPI003D991EDA
MRRWVDNENTATPGRSVTTPLRRYEVSQTWRTLEVIDILATHAITPIPRDIGFRSDDDGTTEGARGLHEALQRAPHFTGQTLSGLLWTDEALALLDGYGWNDGGCVILARALSALLEPVPHELVAVISDKNPRFVQHALVSFEAGGKAWFLDANGTSTLDEVMRADERIIAPRIVRLAEAALDPEIPQDQHSIERVAEYLRSKGEWGHRQSRFTASPGVSSFLASDLTPSTLAEQTAEPSPASVPLDLLDALTADPADTALLLPDFLDRLHRNGWPEPDDGAAEFATAAPAPDDPTIDARL